ncbi:Gb1-cadherin [Phytophthora palmivora]|uniref:Gb1-cadherin n=1 Tax=Phytophthora palmivora TaxID=4796 RepID=A0A2P4WZX6_9STRA|nr:Gb1-cadherin [Phytophthora palmivora]
MFTPTKTRALIRAAAARLVEFRAKGSAGQHGALHAGNSGGRVEEISGFSDRIEKSSRASANAGEQKRKARGNVTIRQVVRVQKAEMKFLLETLMDGGYLTLQPTLTSQETFVTEVDDERGTVYLSDVVYAPEAEHGLFSPGLAAEQGFDFEYDHDTLDFRVTYEVELLLRFSVRGHVGIFVTHLQSKGLEGPFRFTCALVGDSGTSAQFNEGHGRQESGEGADINEAGRARTLGRLSLREAKEDAALQRELKAPNQAAYVDVLILSQGSGTRFESVQVIRDGYVRFVTVHVLTSKSSKVINLQIMKYIRWAERQTGRIKDGAERVKYRFRLVWTDKGGEFMNCAMKKR